MRARVAILAFVITTTSFASESLEKVLATNPELEAEQAFAKGDQRCIVLPIPGSAKGEVLPGWPLQYTPAHLETIEKGKSPFTCADLASDPDNLALRGAAAKGWGSGDDWRDAPPSSRASAAESSARGSGRG